MTFSREEIERVTNMERQAMRDFRDYLQKNKESLLLVAGFGDGECGDLIHILKDELLGPSEIREYIPKPYSKKKISNRLRNAVYRRDQYRCLKCGDWSDLTLDHVIPESRGGQASMDNLQTLCRVCNSKKGVKNV